LAVQSPIYCDGKAETTPNTLGMHLPLCRQIIAEVVATFQKHGDRHIIYTDGLDLWTPAEAPLMFDGLHPDGAGHRLLAQRYVQVIWPRLRALGCS
jgi:lysophospholipase L1-like esterase